MCKYKKIISLIAACLSTVILCDYAKAEEIAPFRLTGVDGEVYARYFNDIYRQTSLGVEPNRREGKTLEEGFDLTLHSYIYHPNFFRLDFGGGPVYIRHIYDSSLVHNSGGEEILNYHAKANILEKKPYPLMLYYDRHYNTTPYAVQDRMLLRNESYGLNFKLKRPLLPFLTEFDFRRSSIDGEIDNDLFTLITDETTDKGSVKVSGALGSNGSGVINLSRIRSESGSGSRSVDPIDTRDINKVSRAINQLDARTEHLFGNDEWIRFTNTFLYKDQDNLPDLEEIRYTPRVNLTHSRTLKSFYKYSYLDRTIEEIDTTAHEFDAGLNLLSLSDRLETDIEVHADRYETEGLEQSFYQADAKLSYLQPLNKFKIRYTGGWGVDYTDRQSEESSISVRAETYTIDNRFDSFILDNRNVIESTIEVFNSQGDLCVEGTHYILTTVADITEIEWQSELDDLTCPLLPDNQVFVSYAYDSGGTATFIGLRQLYGIDLTRDRYLRLYGRYHRIDRELDSGNPTIPLNSEATFTLGLNADFAFRNILTYGGKTEFEDHDADVGSYRRCSLGGYVQLSKFIKGNLRLFADRLRVDNINTNEDVDLTRYGVRYQSRVWYRTRLTADVMDERDTGGTRDRYNRQAKARLTWAYRKLNFSAEARYRLNELGESESERSSISLILSRRF